MGSLWSIQQINTRCESYFEIKLSFQIFKNIHLKAFLNSSVESYVVSRDRLDFCLVKYK